MDNTIEMDVVNFKKIFKEDTSFLTILGSTGCGKTTLLKHILCKTKHLFTNVYLYQGSSPSKDNIYINYIWPHDIHYIKDPTDKMMLEQIKKDVNNYMQDMSEYNTTITDLNKKNKKQIPLIKTLFIFDDFGQSNRNIANFSNTSRHSLVSFIFIIHNDTDLDLIMRKKMTQCLINVNFEVGQILDNFKNKKNDFEYMRKKFLDNDQNRCFLMLDKNNYKHIDYCNLSKEDVKKINNNTNAVFYKTSKERGILKELFDKIYKEKN